FVCVTTFGRFFARCRLGGLAFLGLARLAFLRRGRALRTAAFGAERMTATAVTRVMILRACRTAGLSFSRGGTLAGFQRLSPATETFALSAATAARAATLGVADRLGAAPAGV